MFFEEFLEHLVEKPSLLACCAPYALRVDHHNYGEGQGHGKNGASKTGNDANRSGYRRHGGRMGTGHAAQPQKEAMIELPRFLKSNQKFGDLSQYPGRDARPDRGIIIPCLRHAHARESTGIGGFCLYLV